MSDEPEDTEYVILPNTDGTATMVVGDKEFGIGKQCLPDAEWAAKMQAKANIFGASLEE